jgi:hypothetical protein
MAKKLQIKTKLSDRDAPEKSMEREKLNLVKGDKTYPRSYRWRDYDLKLIEGLVAKANEVSNRKMDATKIIRGALFLADKKNAKQLFEAIMEAEKNSLISRLK